ncbi:ras GTPase-activating protein 4-like isoform X3 [Accipiter gentilis]|uniref:ras GTPase-activating protein 4-like isoform X3 n=1 Tax=Astur gentilis TaxID=8957 RepID=UPI00210FA18C|nr:ras GTPase-activating protein 4-like isoform X3 [Accipiter gentilis]
MARRSALSIRIVEGRNLPAKDITGSSDPYCIVKIDNEAIVRTATVWKTLSPFWGEEYEVQLQPNFHSISIYVMDEDALSRDDVIGKVCITRDMLAEHPKGYSGWMSLSEVDPDEEVQGEIHLRVEVLGSPGSRRLLRCTVLEARDLARKDRNGASDPFVRLRYNGKVQESTVVKKSCYPRWNETFEFELAEPAGEKLCVEVWDWDLVGRNDFLGKVVFSVQGLEAAGQEEGWFGLRPDKSKPREDEHRGSLGSLQLQVRLRDETVLPSQCYQPLVQLLCQEVKSGRQDGQVHLVTLLDETTTAECRQEVAVNLVKLFLGQGLVKEFLDLLFELELAKPCEPNTLFRSNSLASKSMESFLKVTGMPYLHAVLGPTITRVFEEKKYVELDPGKVLGAAPGADGGRGDRAGPPAPPVLPGRAAGRHHQVGPRVSPRHPRRFPAALPARRGAIPPAPARQVRGRHQLPLPPLLLAGHHDPQALSPAGDARRRAHQPHAAAPGQGCPDGGQHGAGSRAGQGDLAGTAAARPAAGHRPDEGLHLPAGGDGGRGGGRRGGTAGPPRRGGEGGAALRPQDAGQGAAAGRRQEAPLLPHRGGPQLRQEPRRRAQRRHRPGRHPRCREGGGEELRELPRHAGGLRGRGWAAGDGLPPVQVRQRAEPVAVGPAQGLRQQPPRAPCLPPRRLPRGQVELLSPEGEDRTGVTPWTPRRRRSASSTTFRGSEGPSGKSTGSCWSQRVPQMAPGMKAPPCPRG